MADKVLITMGLPASGKTTFAEEYCDKHNDSWYISRKKVLNICIDEEKEMRRRRKLTADQIIGNLFDDGYSEIIIDGLFLTNEDIIRVLNLIPHENVKSVEIHYWNPDIEKCLHNDIGRRNQNSTIAIKNGTLEYPDVEKIAGNTMFKNISIMTHNVVEKPYWKVKADEYGVPVEDHRYLYSDSWSLGGSWGNCWGESGSVSGEPAPSDFKQLDELLEKVCPTITFLQYKNIFSQCVDTETYDQGDYYGGSVEYAKYRCDLEKLFDLLKDKLQ